MNAENLAKLYKRIDEEYLTKRLLLQKKLSIITRGENSVRFVWRNLYFVRNILLTFFKISGLHSWAAGSTSNYIEIQNQIEHPMVPHRFDGYRILQLSDLHIDAMIAGTENLCSMLQSMPPCDLCVITGDFRFWHEGNEELFFDRMQNLVAAINCQDGIIGILGNHDYIDIVPALEDMGIKMLLNEAVAIERLESKIRIAGVDDPNYYMVDDLNKALRSQQEAGFTMLLAHSSEIAEQAATAGVAAYLCGHTHGGQVCLPGGIPIINNARSPREQLSGPWRVGSMLGYTSQGTGFSGLPIRVFCPPEVTVHTLVATKKT